MFKPFKIIFPIAPVAKQRHRSTKTGHIYTPKETVVFERSIKMIWKAARLPILPVCPTKTTAEFYFKRPKSTRQSTIYKITKPDTDNLQKSLLDALNGLAWKDDNQICDSRQKKLYTDQEPYIALLVEPLEEPGAT